MEALAGITDIGLIQPTLPGGSTSLPPPYPVFKNKNTSNMAAHEDIQKSSSMPSTPQSFLYFEADSPFPQSASEEVWHSTKRRRTQRPSSETQFIHMNGYKSDSQVGTRFNNTYVDSYADSTTFENTQNKSAEAASTPEGTPVVESVARVTEDRSEPISTKVTRSSRKPAERSTETSSRVLKVKCGTGSSQPTNIQTFIFKTKLDPRLSYRDRSDEPATPSSTNENTEVKVENAPAEPATKSTRKTRKSEANANMLKFKSYTPNATPVLRLTTRKPSRQDQFADADSPIPSSTADEINTAFSGNLEQDKQASPDKASQYETPMKDDAGEVNSAQRRSTRIRKPVKSLLIEETPKKEKSHKEQGFTSGAQSGKTLTRSLSTTVADHASHAPSNASPSTPVLEASYSHGLRDDGLFDRYGTPSPDGLSANTRTSGRLRKPTIKAIEALQSRPKSRKRLRDSEQMIDNAESFTNNGKSTPEPMNTANISTVSMSRSTSGVGSEGASFSFDDPDDLGRLLYDLAHSAFEDMTSTPENEEAKIAEWRQAFNKRKDEQVPVTADESIPQEAPATEENVNLPGEMNAEIPLDHPDRPRPWTEEDGWMHTGRVNKHGEEYCIAPADKYQWVKHTSNYRTPVGPIPTPPPVIKSTEEIRRDNIYGFPPCPGKRNLYQKHPGQVWRREDVQHLVDKSLIPANSLGGAGSSNRGSGQEDAMNIDDAGMKTRYIHRLGLPRFKRPLKLVLVDSTKLKSEGGNDLATLRKRRQSGHASEASSSKLTSRAVSSSHRKRSLDMTGTNDTEGTEETQPQRKKRQSTVKAEKRAVEDQNTTPARQKRQSTIAANQKGGSQSSTSTPAPPKSASSTAKAGHRGQTLILRTSNSEKAPNKSASTETPRQVHEEAPTPSMTSRARRRTTGVPKSNEI